jgi:hypothetical protein
VDIGRRGQNSVIDHLKNGNNTDGCHIVKCIPNKYDQNNWLRSKYLYNFICGGDFFITIKNANNTTGVVIVKLKYWNQLNDLASIG